MNAHAWYRPILSTFQVSESLGFVDVTVSGAIHVLYGTLQFRDTAIEIYRQLRKRDTPEVGSFFLHGVLFAVPSVSHLCPTQALILGPIPAGLDRHLAYIRIRQRRYALASYPLDPRLSLCHRVLPTADLADADTKPCKSGGAEH
jgi:hypothetical protein